MEWWNKLTGKCPHQRRDEMRSGQDVEIVRQSAQRIVDVVNESLRIANSTRNSDTKESRLRVAENNLAELERMAREFPFLQIGAAREVKKNIEEIRRESITNYAKAANDNDRARQFERQGNTEEAIQIYEAMLRDSIDTPFTYRRLAIIYRKEKRPEEERRVLETALANIPESNRGHYEWFEERLGKLQKSLSPNAR